MRKRQELVALAAVATALATLWILAQRPPSPRYGFLSSARLIQRYPEAEDGTRYAVYLLRLPMADAMRLVKQDLKTPEGWAYSTTAEWPIATVPPVAGPIVGFDAGRRREESVRLLPCRLAGLRPFVPAADLGAGYRVERLTKDDPSGPWTSVIVSQRRPPGFFAGMWERVRSWVP